MASRKQVAITGFGITLMILLGISIFASMNFKTVIVQGDSMLPTFKTGRKLVYSSAYWLVGQIKDNDIVVVADGDGQYIIKRVYKMGGEKVDWWHVPKTWKITNDEYIVPDNHVYLLGDNRAVSEDSRVFGPVEVSRIVGKVVIRP